MKVQILGTGWPTRAKWVGMWRGLRTREHVYARFHDGRRLLFDRTVDPLEMDNLAQDKEHSELVAKMEARLQGWLAETGDPFDTGSRLPVTDMLDLGQAFSHNYWLDHAPRAYADAIRGNDSRFATGEKDHGPVTFNW